MDLPDTPAMADVERRARRLADHPVLEKLARGGFVMSGVLHLLIAFLAAQVALGGSRGHADQSGALAMVRQSPFGAVLLWVMAAGLLALALWLLVQAVLPAFGTETKERLTVGAKGVVYLVLAVAAFGFATGGKSSGSGGEQTQSLTARVMAAPGGQVLVGLVGLGVLVFGIYYAYRGISRKFTENLEANPGEWPVRMGVAGYVAKGFALAVVGALVVLAAVTLDPEKSQGLDGALKSLGEQPFGTVLLLLVALGFAAYGVWCFYRAKHEDL